MRQIISMTRGGDHHQKGFIVWGLLLAAAVLGAALLIQPDAVKSVGQTVWQKGQAYIFSSGQEAGREVAQKTELVKQEAVQQKDSVVQGIFENVKNYLAGIFSDTFGTKVK